MPGGLLSIMPAVHAQRVCAQPLERPPYVNTGKSSESVWSLAADCEDCRRSCYRTRGTEVRGGKVEKQCCFHIKGLQLPCPHSQVPNRCRLRERERERKALLALITWPEVFP